MKKKRLKASLTLEASLSIPILLLVLVGFLYFFHIIYVYEHIQYGISNMARDLTKYSYLYEEKDELTTEYMENSIDIEERNLEESTFLEEGVLQVRREQEDEQEKFMDKEDTFQIVENLLAGVYIKNRLSNYVNEDLMNNSLIDYGMNGIHTYFSKFMEDNKIHIVVHYEISVPFGILSINSIPIIQRVTVSGWTGIKEDSLEEEKVDSEGNVFYVTEYGTVFHKARDCTYINIIIQSISYNDLINHSNREKKDACSICITAFSERPSMIYVTRTGNKYHYSINCRSLKRTIHSISEEETTNYSSCKRCN